MFGAIDRYLARLIAVPLIATMVVSAMLLLLEKMGRLFDFVAAEGGPVSVVFRMLANTLPEYLSLGIPIGLMLGILLTFRKIALSSELDILRAVGMGYGRLLRVPFLFAIGLAALNLVIVGYMQPYSRFAYEQLRYELRSGALGASIKVGEFTNLGQRMTLRIEQSSEEGRKLSGIFVRVREADQTLAVTAARGQFLATDDPDTIILRLTDGILVHNKPSFKAPRTLSFSSHDLPIDLPKTESFRGRGGKDLEMTLPELYAASGDKTKPESFRNQSWAAFNFRMAEVAMMFLLPLAAVAFAIPPKRSTSALGVFLSIILIVTYHKINQYAQSLGALGRVDPVVAMWVPFAAVSALIIWMYYMTAYVPGGQPIGALERNLAKLGKWIAKWFRFGRGRVQRVTS